MRFSKAVLTFAALAARILPVGVKRWIYQSEPLAGLVRGWLNRAAPQGLTEVQVAAGALAGCRLLIDLQAEKDYWLGTYEPEIQMALDGLVQPGMSVYDVGANIGYITLQLARRVGENGQVAAFEVLPENLERLRRNLVLNHVDHRVEIVPRAVLDGERKVHFLVAPSGGMGKAEGSAGRRDVVYSETIEVEAVSLDGFVYGSHKPVPELIKMDIEGGEVLALPGMRRVLAEARPVLLMELHGTESAQVAWEILAAAGYRITRLLPAFPIVHTWQELDWKAYLAAFPEEKKDVG